MAPPAERVLTVCQDLLAAVVAHYAAESEPLPERQYVSAGAPAWDCELLAAWCERTAGHSGNVAAETAEPHVRHPGHAMRAGTFVVTLVRCTPALPDVQGDQVALPSVADEEAAASALYRDAQLILNAVVTAEHVGALGGCHGLAFLEWRVIGPDGGLVAGELRLRADLVRG